MVLRPCQVRKGRRFCSHDCAYKKTGEKISQSLKGMFAGDKNVSKRPEVKAKMSLSMKLKWQDVTFRNKHLGENHGNFKDAKVQRKCDNCGKEIEFWPSISPNRRFCSRKCLWEWRKRTGFQTGMSNPMYGKKRLDFANRYGNRESFYKRMWRAIGRKPNKQEKRLLKLIRENNLPFKYVGNGKLVIDSYCPDFVATNGQKRIIELFGDYWHQGENEEERIRLFKQFGFETLVIWEHDLKDEIEVLRRVTDLARA